MVLIEQILSVDNPNLLLKQSKTTIQQMRDLRLKHITIIFSFILLACQDTDLETENPVDTEMEEAWAIANEFLSTSRNGGTDADVTVIKYKSDLEYKTNTIAGGYQPINEETITAESMPGGYVFWHAGGGVKELLAIEMDSTSQIALGQNEPFEVVPGHYWALWIPIDIDVETLKYDIVYMTKENEIIRLDPKIQVKSTEE